MSNRTKRPLVITPEITDLICEQIAAGLTTRTICKPETMPSVQTFFRWLREDESFRESYARAKEDCADSIAEEILEICDDASNDWMEKKGENGDNLGWQLNGEHVQRSKLRVDSRKWLAAKLKPKKYGDRQIVDQQVTFSLSQLVEQSMKIAQKSANKVIEHEETAES